MFSFIPVPVMSMTQKLKCKRGRYQLTDFFV